MTPTRTLVESTITNNILSAKACGHMAQAKLLVAWKTLGNIKVKLKDDKKDEALFLHAYGQAGEVSTFNVDTDPSKNLGADTDGLKLKCDGAFSRITEMKVSWDGITPETKDQAAYTDAMKLLDEALENIQTARDYADTAIQGTRLAEKHSFTTQDAAEA